MTYHACGSAGVDTAWFVRPGVSRFQVFYLGEDSANSDFAISGVFCWDGAFYALAAGAVYSADQSEVEIRDFGLHALNFDEEAGTVRLELALPMDGKADDFFQGRFVDRIVLFYIHAEQEFGSHHST